MWLYNGIGGSIPCDHLPNPQPKLEEQLRGVMRLKQYSRRTEEGYVQWDKRYVVFQSQVTGRMRHPKEMGAAEVTALLTNLTVNRTLVAYSKKEDAKPSLSRPFF